MLLFRGAGALNIERLWLLLLLLSALSASRAIGNGVFLLITAPFEPMNIAGPVDTLNAGFSRVLFPVVPVERCEDDPPNFNGVDEDFS